MILLLPAAYFPATCYMAEILQAGQVMIESDESYPKQTWRNRCEIYGPNGRQILSIPVTKPFGNRTKTREIRLSDHEPWQRIHWRSIETAYNNSPFFIYYQDAVRKTFEQKYHYLLDLNLAILHMTMELLREKRTIGLTGYFEKSHAAKKDLRYILSEKNAVLSYHYPAYTQVFEPAHGFISGLSVLDVIFNLGPEASGYLHTISRLPLSDKPDTLV